MWTHSRPRSAISARTIAAAATRSIASKRAERPADGLSGRASARMSRPLFFVCDPASFAHDQLKKHLTLRNFVAVVIAGAVLGFAVFWIVTIPATVPASALPQYTPNAGNGKTIFNIGGCSSCHAVPNKDPQKVDRLRLGGGLELPSPFGSFTVPNISPNTADGIGNWSEADFVTAMWDGTAPDGSHLYPAFPYPSYRHMELADVRDLFAYLKTLPPVAGKAGRPRSGFSLQHPPSARRLEVSVSARRAVRARRKQIGAMESEAPIWSPDRDTVPNVTRRAICSAASSRANDSPAARHRTAKAGCRTSPRPDWQHEETAWSEKDIAEFLSTAMNPSGDFAGGSMAEVIQNTSLLRADDRAAIANYIASLPPVRGPTPPPKKQ